MTASPDINQPVWSVEHGDFDGNAGELAERLTDLMPRFDWAANDPDPSIRLIRFYTQEGALDRPERRGKEAFYGFRQLVQFVALRWLLNDGWPLAKAAIETATRATEELIALVPVSAGGPVSASELVQRFQADARLSTKPMAAAIVASQLDLSARVGRLARARAAYGESSAPPEPRETLRLDLADWCAVFVDAEALNSLTDEKARALGDALAEALIDARISRTARKKKG